MQLLREAPESKPFFPAPRRNPYIQSLMVKLKEEGMLDLAAIDWNAFEIADVTIPYFQEHADSDANGWVKGIIHRAGNAPAFQSRRRVFF